MTNQELAYTEIQRLITQFKNLPASQRKGLSEMQTRLGYILPMFKALGWDTSNINEVSPEEKVSRGWVDFSFRIGNVPRYFLETKRVNEDLNDPRWVKQAIDYAWTKSVTWALLSDFEGLRVFNAEWKESDPFRAQFFEFGLDDYLKDFERFWWLSKEETAKRRLDVEAEKVGRKIKRLPVSQNLFSDLKRWRENLFKNYKAFNLGYSTAQVDEAVLRLLNRLIFIRTAEDREVEENRLQSLVRVLKDKKQIQILDRELASLFRELDGIYNSELFARHFSEELQIPPTELEEIINGLYQKDYVRYNFNALEADVLGTAYEQYLGHIVAESETETHVEEKRTKRKSQGIYYTPAFVTKYIVQQTVGKYLDENGYNPSKPPRVLDMACGSGSFLIEAFDVIDDFVAKQRGQAQKGEVDFYDRARQLEVLQNCIFGVDKDKQAVEVARLNLLLRGLHSREKLPMLENISYADSLKPETWDWEFSRTTEGGVFDVIIGNPPYIRAENMPREERDYYMSGVFESAYGRFDIFILFIEIAIKHLKEGGVLGFIIPRALLNQNYAREIRRIILEKCTIEQIVDFEKNSVFDQAAIDTCIIILKKAKQDNHEIRVIKPADEISDLSNVSIAHISQDEFTRTPQFAFRLNLDNEAVNLVEHIKGKSLFVGDICYVDMGLIAFYKEKNVEGVTSKESYISNKQSKRFSKPYAEGKDLQNRYQVLNTNRFIWYEPDSMHRPKFAELFENSKIVVSKITGNQGLRATIDESGIYVESTLNCCVLANMLETTGKVTPESVELSKGYTLEYLLGLINSKLLGWYYKHLLMRSLDVYPDNVRQLPIRKINFSNSAEKIAHDEISKLVKKILALQKDRQAVRPEDDLDHARKLDRQIKDIDSDIDKRVFKLYGLSDEEIKIVEGSL
ncbi:MAG: N-6 DNA methylase [Chloroflexi bacterium]|nr:hypothetical protein [Chloroflexota bacterium]NOG74923.1 N-6 DNA methylase [Chloroflexota bacterium]